MTISLCYHISHFWPCKFLYGAPKYLMSVELIFSKPCITTWWGTGKFKLSWTTMSQTQAFAIMSLYVVISHQKLRLGASLLGNISGFCCHKDCYGTNTNWVEYPQLLPAYTLGYTVFPYPVMWRGSCNGILAFWEIVLLQRGRRKGVGRNVEEKRPVS